MYLWLKVVHVIAVVVFLGNIATGLYWHVRAARTRNPTVLAFTMDGIIVSDRLFTMPGVFAILASGIGAALVGGYPLLRTGWILWPIVLFAVSGILFGLRVAPLQRELHALAVAGRDGGSWDAARYAAVSARWEFWGALALLAPVLALFIMVLKPAI